jgi:hypothetical protein
MNRLRPGAASLRGARHPGHHLWSQIEAAALERFRLCSSARNSVPRVRLASRSAQDAIARLSNDNGAIESPHLPHGACDATAPDSSKTIPA